MKINEKLWKKAEGIARNFFWLSDDVLVQKRARKRAIAMNIEKDYLGMYVGIICLECVLETRMNY